VVAAKLASLEASVAKRILVGKILIERVLLACRSPRVCMMPHVPRLRAKFLEHSF